MDVRFKKPINELLRCHSTFSYVVSCDILKLNFYRFHHRCNACLRSVDWCINISINIVATWHTIADLQNSAKCYRQHPRCLLLYKQTAVQIYLLLMATLKSNLHTWGRWLEETCHKHKSLWNEWILSPFKQLSPGKGIGNLWHIFVLIILVSRKISGHLLM